MGKSYSRARYHLTTTACTSLSITTDTLKNTFIFAGCERTLRNDRPPRRVRSVVSAAGRPRAPGEPGADRDVSGSPRRAGAKPASLGRYKASLARVHRLLGLTDPTADEQVRMTLAEIRRAE